MCRQHTHRNPNTTDNAGNCAGDDRCHKHDDRATIGHIASHTRAGDQHTAAIITLGDADRTQPIPTETLVPLPKVSLNNEGINVSNYNNDNIAALQPFGFGWIQVFNPPEFPIPNYKILHRVTMGNAISGQPADINAWAAQLEKSYPRAQGRHQCLLRRQRGESGT